LSALTQCSAFVVGAYIVVLVLCFNAFISVHICLSSFLFFIVFLPIFGE